MKIIIAPDGWGESGHADICAVLESVESQLSRFIRVPIDETVSVVPAPDTDPCPKTHYRGAQSDPSVVQLSARNRDWAQFAFQFSHELCHVLSGYDRLKANPNQWFHEAICETASLFTLRRMAEIWSAEPPYQNWATYSVHLLSYAEDRLEHPEHRLPAEMTLSEWLASLEDALRQDPYQREKNAIVAGELLPLFESDPSGWNAVRSLPTSSSRLKDYLLEWRFQAEPVDRPFVERINRRLEE